ncbi:hypothetical protein [Bdellovibrio bacteriovorus]|uniref:Lipoprotein n=1 Tax=Bdellovibrio bacteriovorus str. Tiberius TaxID=1069642 RepID=K7ZE40_BDEBC|nr:hypothetical protein [Bdellovibrio bacteriovorus]AFY00127.1 hypothetical protein Bdt_0419 [Bdellovibrio bacteriovorus str. Tiberius]
MKTQILKCSLSVALLSLAACSGGGGGGGGSASGDVAAPSSSITAPPTAAKGTSAEMDTISGSGAQTTTLLNNAVSSFDISTFTSQLPAFHKPRGGDSCMQAITPESDWVDQDQDGFKKNLSVKFVNCTETETDGDFAGLTWIENSSLTSTDANDSSPESNGSMTGKGDTTWKNGSGTVIAKGYAAGSLTLDIAKATMVMNYKNGGYNNAVEPKIENGYMAFWLTLAVTDPETSAASTATGYVQIYKEGKGLVTLSIASSGYNFDEADRCLKGGSITLKYADGSTAAGPTAKDICFTQQASK